MYYYEPPCPICLNDTWLRLTFGKRTYAPHLVRLRMRRFPATMIRQFDPRPREHSHRIYHLVYFLEGSNTISLATQPVPVRAGQLVLIDPDVSHDIVPREPRDCAFITLMFTYQCGSKLLALPFTELLAKLTNRRTEPGQTVDDHYGRLRSFFAFLQNEVLEKSTRCPENIGYCLAGLLNELAGTALHGSRKDQIPEDMLVVRQYLLNNLDRELTISHLTRIAHISRSHLLDKFKRYYGISPIAFLIRERIEKAKAYLLHSSRRIKEIAGLCGFKSEYYFNKTFKKHTRLTPGQFRKANMSSGD